MSDIQSLILLFLVGAVSGFINVNAGGGSSLTLPTLIFLGLDSALANGTNRISILIQSFTAVSSFKKEKYSDFTLSLKIAWLTLPGSIVGSLLVINLSDEVFEKVLGAVMIGIVLSMVIPRKKVLEIENNSNVTWPVYLAMFFIGFYGGFIQVGVGFILMAVLQYLMKLNLVLVNMHKVFIVMIFTVPATIVFIATGNIDWPMALVLAAGNSLGAWWAAKFAVKKGEKLIRVVLITAILIMSLKLFEIF
ncbi:MAG: sulfite exporter TauE/SafE family protein [Bacteroidetes bacterium]|nr:sulfite exporter TauE/SafE family protein [Bacteroidota bacterium]